MAADQDVLRRPTAWVPGQSGNPAGKPPGTPCRPWPGLPRALKQVAKVDGPEILQALVKAAKAGDVGAGIALLGMMGGTPRARP